VNHAKFLKITLPLAVILAAVALFLPVKTADIYHSVMELAALFGGALLALRISFLYRKQLRTAFACFSAFLFIYGVFVLAFPFISKVMSSNSSLLLIVAVQTVDYVLLTLFCVNLLGAMRLGDLNKNAWITLGVTAAVCYFLALFPPMYDGIIDSSFNIIIYMAIRVIDATLVVALVPVIWLYISYLKSQQRQSLTFTVIITGIICATLLDYLFETIARLLLPSLTGGWYTVIPYALFIFSFFVILAGLYAHLKDEQWGFAAIDKAMADGLEMFGEE